MYSKVSRAAAILRDTVRRTRHMYAYHFDPRPRSCALRPPRLDKAFKQLTLYFGLLIQDPLSRNNIAP